jgi:putative ABC transport system permease protein
MWRITLRSLAAHRRRLVATTTAVGLGVAFMSATLAVGATVTTGFADVLARANAGIDVVVRSSVVVGSGDFPERGLVARALVDTIAAVDGVAAVAPRIEGSGRIVGLDGDPVGGGGPTIVGDWIDDDQLNPYDLVEGRAPRAAGEVVIDKAAAAEGGLTVGDRTSVRLPDPVSVTVVGLVTYGGADSQGSATYAAFSPEVAAAAVLPDPGAVSSIVVAARPGVSQTELADRLGSVLPEGVEAITGARLTDELREQIQGDDGEAFQQALLLFTVVALVVAILTINNTFSILVTQRTRESGLLRALGASRGQVLRSVAGEALVVGLVGSAGGLAAGMGLAAGLLAFMDALGLSTPAAVPALDAGTFVAGFAVGLAVTLVSSLTPAVRASRVAPLAALRDMAVDRSATSRWRARAGALITGAGVALTIVGATTGAPLAAAPGALATLVGVVVLGPVAARWVAASVGAPLAALSGVSGVLAQRNAVRNPRRTSGAGVSLMIGVAVASLFTVAAGSLSRSIDEAVSAQFAGDLVIVGEGRGGLSTDLAAALAELPEVVAASPLGSGHVRVNGRDTLATTVDPATIGSVVMLDVRQGSMRDLGTDRVGVSVSYAVEHDLALGDPVTVAFADGVTRRPTVGAIYANDNLVASAGIVLPRELYLPHTSRPVDTNMLIRLSDGVSEVAGEQATQRVADRFGAPDVLTNDEFTDMIAAEINVLITIVYVLLAIAIVIALMSIATTLALSVHERTRELGLLRAVGQTRRQTRAMLRGEAMVVSLFGTVSGLTVGLFLGWSFVSAFLSVDGFVASFAVPALPLAAVLVLGTFAGALAAVRPARRAARVPVLSAISVE